MDTVSKAILGLPGIATDQPDVFETPDVQKSDHRSMQQIPIQDTNVEIIKVSQGDAFKRFEKTSLLTNDVDFRDVHFGRRGYQTWGEWQLPEGSRIIREDETVLEKYHRLKTEVAELQQQLQGLEGDEAPLSGDLTVGNVIKNLSEFTNSLQSMKVQQWAESDLLCGARQETSVLSKLEKDVEKLTTSTEKKSGEGGKKSAEGGKKPSGIPAECLTYELLCRPQLSRSGDLSILNQLEQKLNRIENVVGMEKTSMLTNVSNERTISDAVAVLSRKVSQLDPSHLEQIDGRLTSLSQKLIQIQERKGRVEDVERDARLSTLLQICKETESQRLALPLIVSRLNSLSQLEQQGMDPTNSFRDFFHSFNRTQLLVTTFISNFLFSLIKLFFLISLSFFSFFLILIPFFLLFSHFNLFSLLQLLTFQEPFHTWIHSNHPRVSH